MFNRLIILANFVSLLSCQVLFEDYEDGSEQRTFNNSELPNCQTSDGRDCVIPFIYENVTYNGCTTKNDPDGKFWCSTKVDPDTKIHITNENEWGHCNENCNFEDSQDVIRTVTKLEFPGEDEEPEIACKTSNGEDGVCKPVSTCSFASTDIDLTFGTCSQKSHICCKELLQNDPNILEKLGAADSEEEVAEKPENISVDQVEELLTSLRFGLTASAVEAEEEIDESENVEDFDAVSLHNAFNRPRADVFSVDQTAITFEKTAEGLQNSNEEEPFISTRFFSSETSSRINNDCPWTPAPSCDSVSKSKFRTIDGSCNNLQEPNYGRAATPFQRILDSQYSFGTLANPRVAKNGFDLPSARKLSTSVTKSSANVERKDGIRTVLVMQMGQFIDHDITHTPQHAQSCCNKDGTFPSQYDANKCFPIEIPSDDPFWGGRKRCMGFGRSLASPTLKCNLESRQQMNQITHWLDASNIYGSTASEAHTLRQNSGGLLKISPQSGSKRGVLPSCNREVSRSSIAMCTGCTQCFFAGDVRANEQLNLIVMHTLWMREHNRIARFLNQNNPGWEDNRIFEEARRIVIAEYQHIIYNEWLPLIVGTELMTTFGLWPLSKGYSDQYLDNFDPRVTNEFATAAFRFGHSLIPSTFSRIGSERNSRSGRQVSQDLKMKDIFFKPQEFKNSAGMMDDLIRGLTSQSGEEWDNVFSEDITNHLFETTKNGGGLDLVALNIQRGRDHGLPGYNSYRKICGVGEARNFDDLVDYMTQEDVERLKSLYNDVNDIDLFVGGFLERRHRDSVLGPTFKCIIADTFARLKIGDRFFYDLGKDQRTQFSVKQLREIRKASMARIICDNSERIFEIQPQVFKIFGKSEDNLNRQVNCEDFESIPSVNLNFFADGL